MTPPSHGGGQRFNSARAHMQRYRLGSKIVEVLRGDITACEADIIVNAANNWLKHYGGVALAIVKKGGRIIQEESDKIGYVPTGNAVATTAGKLKARYVVHAVGPRANEQKASEKLKRAILSALKLSEKLEAKSVAMPAISTGTFGFPKRDAAQIFAKTIADFLRNAKHVREIKMVLYDSETYSIFVEEFEKHFASISQQEH